MPKKLILTPDEDDWWFGNPMYISLGISSEDEPLAPLNTPDLNVALSFADGVPGIGLNFNWDAAEQRYTSLAASYQAFPFGNNVGQTHLTYQGDPAKVGIYWDTANQSPQCIMQAGPNSDGQPEVFTGEVTAGPGGTWQIDPNNDGDYDSLYTQDRRTTANQFKIRYRYSNSGPTQEFVLDYPIQSTVLTPDVVSFPMLVSVVQEPAFFAINPIAPITIQRGQDYQLRVPVVQSHGDFLTNAIPNTLGPDALTTTGFATAVMVYDTTNPNQPIGYATYASNTGEIVCDIAAADYGAASTIALTLTVTDMWGDTVTRPFNLIILDGPPPPPPGSPRLAVLGTIGQIPKRYGLEN